MSPMTLFTIALILGIACQRIGSNCGGIITFVTRIAGLAMIVFGIYGMLTALI